MNEATVAAAAAVTSVSTHPVFADEARELLITASLPAIVTLLFLALWVESNRADSKFRLVHFFTDARGRGSKAAFAYIVTLIVGVWAVWAYTLRGALPEWLWTSLLAGFVIGALGTTAAQVIQNVQNKAPQPPADAGDAPKSDQPPGDGSQRIVAADGSVI